jgi:hypothetical protein
LTSDYRAVGAGGGGGEEEEEEEEEVRNIRSFVLKQMIRCH